MIKKSLMIISDKERLRMLKNKNIAGIKDLKILNKGGYMKRLFFIIFIIFIVSGCKNKEERDYRQDMRNFVQSISSYAKGINHNFIIIPQNGQELITENGNADGIISENYIKAIDGIGREDVFYGYNGDDIPTPQSERDYLISFLNLARDNGKKILVIDYCSTHNYIEDSYYQNNTRGFISFAANHRELDNIPEYPENPYNMNTDNITSLDDAKNFLYLINPSSFGNLDSFLNALKNTNFDILIIDLFFNEIALTKAQVESLKTKLNNGKRLVIAYMSIGEAEDYRYYWKKEWEKNPPEWLAEENPEWEGNYKVRYWYPEWQQIIFGNDSSYLKKIIDAGFDGVYLDIIDAFEYFENSK